MRLNNQHRHPMCIEALEDKRLLAGDVTATVVDGNLLIRGDTESNGVAITSGDMPGVYLVAGIMTDDGPTSINGDFHRAVLGGVSRNILVGMGDGNDTVNMFDLRAPGNVAVFTGLGNDHVNFGGPRTDAGEPNSIVHRGLVVDLGRGNDSLRIGGAAIGRGLNADAGPGDDYVAVVGTRIHGMSNVRTGEGADEVRFERSFAPLANINTGMGDDRVAIVDSVFARLHVDTGAGDDQVAVNGLHARAAWFQGGIGQDTLNIGGGNQVNHFRVAGFETIHGGNGMANEGDALTTIDGLFTA